MKRVRVAILLAITLTTACELSAQGKLQDAAECDNTELRDGGKSVIGEYPDYDLAGLVCMINAVGMPDWARADLQSTRPMDGRMHAEWGDFAASWSYDGDEMSMTVRIK